MVLKTSVTAGFLIHITKTRNFWTSGKKALLNEGFRFIYATVVVSSTNPLKIVISFSSSSSMLGNPTIAS
ncbi:hypothetical protein M5D96_010751 [Drosophila gunungcola]|uniref:Uncharacterized protein n=1 Tax=Drosophila gunungcola TaxID=103775 RepID=A0A9P9YGA0_9MUSC|nr:hypothetical protein M5D96_010751 [Drosophila gunungcola]